MLVLASAAFFVVPAMEQVQAQSGDSYEICVSPTSGSLVRAGVNSSCPPGSAPQSFPRSGLGVCVSETITVDNKTIFIASAPFIPGSNGPLLSPPLPANGVPSSGTQCLSADKPPVEVGNFYSFASLSTYTPPTNGNGNNGNANTNPTGNANNGNGNGNTGGNTNSGPPPTDGCETGFHKVGPLCVPNSPFNNGDSITGEQTIGGLAARIVRILLYFAGIVAVVMAIVGGYQVMTAGGNQIQAVNGRKTLTNAIIGLAIVILSYIIIQAVIGFIT